MVPRSLNRASASAPGSLMLVGEHAVLYGYPAIVCAINKRVHVTITPRRDTQIHIYSPLLGSFQTTLATISSVPPFQFVLVAIKRYSFNQGFDLQIDTDFTNNLGFGSSAAVTVATLACCNQLLSLSYSKKQLLEQAVAVIHQIQGIGSGADAAASIYGGTLCYQPNTLTVIPLHSPPALTAIYSGKKVATVEVIHFVQKRHVQQPERYAKLFHNIGAGVEQGVRYCQEQQWDSLALLCNQQHAYMQELGISTHLLDALVQQLLDSQKIIGAKISGAGLGDCVVGLGRLSANHFPRNKKQRQLGIQQFDLTIEPLGVDFF